MHEHGTQSSVGLHFGWCRVYGSILVAYEFGHVFTDCRNRAGNYCRICRVCHAYDDGLTPGCSEVVESYLGEASDTAEQISRLEEEVDCLTQRLRASEARVEELIAEIDGDSGSSTTQVTVIRAYHPGFFNRVNYSGFRGISSAPSLTRLGSGAT